MIDWTDALDNRKHVADIDQVVARWPDAAAAYRAAQQRDGLAEVDLSYGPAPRNRFDLFRPQENSRGLVVFIHGGYWHLLDKSYWSHLARGAVSAGWTVAMPSYTLAPEARISRMTQEVGTAITAAATQVPGPIRIIGHSAGGHLVSRMACLNAPLPDEIAARLEQVISVSGLHDLRPIRLAAMNATLGLTEDEAAAESPALQKPRTDLAVTFWVGARERPELVRQTRLIGEAWTAEGARVSETYEPGQDHFSVIEALADPSSPLTAALTADLS